jgi:hypothetical protein
MISDFDIMFNKNPFAVFISGAGTLLQIPAPGQTSYALLPCKIDTKNLDKVPPKSPFMIQVAMKTSLDVFYFTLPCAVHVLIN